MLRGEFRFNNGLVLPNNVTEAGSAAILAAALRNTPITFWVGLCSAVYAPDLRIEDLVEPTLLTNGYARLAVARDSTADGWPGGGLVNGENYLESKALTWSAVDEPFDESVTRMFICQTQDGLAGDVLALSAALPDDLLIGVDTPEVDRTFRYRLYMR
jgi:hypothetical protein